MHPNSKPLATHAEIREALMRYSREPFMNALAEMMECRPDAVQLRVFAAEHPDRFFQAVSVMAKLAGFHDKLEVEHNVNVRISQMSDAELTAELETLMIEGEIVPPKNGAVLPIIDESTPDRTDGSIDRTPEKEIVPS